MAKKQCLTRVRRSRFLKPKLPLLDTSEIPARAGAKGMFQICLVILSLTLFTGLPLAFGDPLEVGPNVKAHPAIKPLPSCLERLKGAQNELKYYECQLNCQESSREEFYICIQNASKRIECLHLGPSSDPFYNLKACLDACSWTMSARVYSCLALCQAEKHESNIFP